MSVPWLDDMKKRGVFQNHALILTLSAKGLPIRNTASQGDYIINLYRLYVCVLYHIFSFMTDETGGKADPYIEIRKAHGLVKTTLEKQSIFSKVGTLVVGAGVGAALAGVFAPEVLRAATLIGAGIGACCILLKSDTVLRPFVMPEDDVYTGSKDRASLVYDGKSDYQELTLEPKWKTIEFTDLARSRHLNSAHHGVSYSIPEFRRRSLCDGSDITKPILIDVSCDTASKGIRLLMASIFKILFQAAMLPASLPPPPFPVPRPPARIVHRTASFPARSDRDRVRNRKRCRFR